MPAAADTITPPAEYYTFLRAHPEYGGRTKDENYYRLAEARAAGALVVNAAPSRLRIEAHGACNLRCCWAQRNPRHAGLRPRGAASPDLVRRVIDQVGDCIYQANFCHWGEPTLNPQLPQLVDLLHRAGIQTTMDSNLTRMTPELAADLVAAGLDWISGSIDGITPATYDQYRVGGDVRRALDGLRHLVAARRQAGRTNPFIRWQFLVFPHNEHEVPAARRLAEEIGVDQFDAFGASGRNWSAATGFQPSPPPQRPAGLLCEDPWHYLAVDWDGAVHLCCRAFQARHVMGHMDAQPLRDIFDNERFQLARRVIRDGIWHADEAPVPCTGCRRVTNFTPALAALGHTLTLD